MNLGISGKMRSGKDTAADYLQQRLNTLGDAGVVVRIAHVRRLAGKLKQLCTDLEFSRLGARHVARDFLDECRFTGITIPSKKEWVIVNQLVDYTVQFKGQGIDGKNRRLLQEVAEYLRAEVNPGLWVHYLLAEHHRYEASQYSLVPDVRKPHEVEDLRAMGFKVIRIDVAPEIQRQRILASGEPYEAAAVQFWTETALDDYTDFDARIENNGTLAEFHAKLDEFLAANLSPFRVLTAS